MEQGPENRVRVHGFSPNYPGKNLKFLIDFFEYVNENPESYGRLGSTSAQALRFQLRNDDMKVSKAMQIADELGYKLEIKLVPRPSEGKVVVSDDSTYRVVLPEQKKVRKPSKTKYNLERIAFLDEAILANKVSQRRMAQMLGYSYGAIQAWLRSDDMKISHVNAIKDKLKLDVEYIFSPKEN